MKIIKKVFTICLILLLVLINLNTYIYASSVNNSNLGKSIQEINSYLKDNIDYNQPEYLNEILDDNGKVPAYSYYPKHVSSRGIKTLKAYNGKIFMGLGDWNDNTGPTKVLYYDTKNDKIVSSGTIDDEAIESFNIIDGSLYTTGCDPRATWGYGSYYKYNETENKWEQNQKKNGWIHVFNIVKFDDKLFMCGAAQKNYTPIQYSTDNGNTFKNVFLYKGTTQVPFHQNLRCYNLFSFNNNLYAVIKTQYLFPVADKMHEYAGIYQYDAKEDKFIYISDYKMANNYSRFPIHSIFNNQYIFLSDYSLYSTTNCKEFTPLMSNLFNEKNENIQASLVSNDTLYLLSYKKEAQSYLTRIYATKDLSTTKLIYEFKTSSTPFAFEYYDNSFYVGTNVGYSSKLDDSAKSGSLYKINLENAKPIKLSLDKEDGQISIIENSNNYSIKYNLSNDTTTFKTTLTFEPSMNENNCKREYSKLKNLSLMYAAVANISGTDIEKSISYFENTLSENISNYSGSFSSPIEYAENIFKDNININNNLFTLGTRTTKKTNDKYVIEATLSINNVNTFNPTDSTNEDKDKNLNSNSNKTSNSSKKVISSTNKLPQTGHFINIKYILILTIFLAIIAIVYLKTKGTNNEQKR